MLLQFNGIDIDEKDEILKNEFKSNFFLNFMISLFYLWRTAVELTTNQNIIDMLKNHI